jgi:hypothetical protein
VAPAAGTPSVPASVVTVAAVEDTVDTEVPMLETAWARVCAAAVRAVVFTCGLATTIAWISDWICVVAVDTTLRSLLRAATDVAI